MKNFPFKHNGKEYWYSRACVCVTAAFCYNKDNELCVLINKRGTATEKENHKWNLPVGYLDFNETLTQCAAREVFEETGVKLPLKHLKLYSINSKPDSGSQDIGFRFGIKLNGDISNYPLNTEHMEENEVESVKWLPISEIDTVNWAWNHKEITADMLNKING